MHRKTYFIVSSIWLFIVIAIMLASTYMVVNLISTGTSLFSQGHRLDAIASVTINGVQVYAKTAITTEQLSKGLGGVSILRDDEGMLFTFEKPGYHSFWMKDMLIPIDIIWIGESSQVVDISHNVKPESYPRIYQPTATSLYVLEVNSGWAERHGVSQGDLVEIKPQTYL